MMDGRMRTTKYAEGANGENSGINRRRTQRKIIRQDLQDCAGSLFLPESADEKHVNPVNPV